MVVEVKMFYATQLLGAKLPSLVYDLTGRSFIYVVQGNDSVLMCVHPYLNHTMYIMGYVKSVVTAWQYDT